MRHSTIFIYQFLQMPPNAHPHMRPTRPLMPLLRKALIPFNIRILRRPRLPLPHKRRMHHQPRDLALPRQFCQFKIDRLVEMIEPDLEEGAPRSLKGYGVGARAVRVACAVDAARVVCGYAIETGVFFDPCFLVVERLDCGIGVGDYGTQVVGVG